MKVVSFSAVRWPCHRLPQAQALKSRCLTSLSDPFPARNTGCVFQLTKYRRILMPGQAGKSLPIN